MNDLVQLLCILVCVTGGVYCLSLLRDCRRQARSLKEPIKSSRDSARRKSVCARVNWLCQLLLATTFLAVAGTLLAGLAYRAAQLLWQENPIDQQLRCAIGTVTFPGCPPVVVRYDSSSTNPSIRFIDCAWKPISDDQLRRLLRKAPKLTQLNLAYTDIADDAMCELGRAPKLYGLCLAGTRIGNLRLQNLAKLKSLAVLNLNGTKITDDGLRCLGDVRSLRELHLCDTAVTDAGLAWLCRLDKLELLRLENTGVTQEGINRLKSKLPGVTITRQPNGNQP